MTARLPIKQTPQTFHVKDIYGIYTRDLCLTDLEWIILHVMAEPETMKIAIEVLKSR